MNNAIIKVGNISIRKMNDDDSDYSLVGKWRDSDQIKPYYGGRDKDNSLESIKDKYAERIAGKTLITPCIIEVNDIPSGYIQYYSFDEEKYKHHSLEAYKNAYGIDVFIAPDIGLSKGIGSKAIKTLCIYLFNFLNADIVEICPRIVNSRAVHAYEKAGFIPYKRIIKGEFFEGKWFEEFVMIKTSL